MTLRPLCLLLLVCCGFLSAAETPPPAAGERPRLGVVLDDGAFDPSQGVPVRSVMPGSSAAALGIKAGDLIDTFNGKPIRSAADMLGALADAKTGDAVTVVVVRDKVKQTLEGKLIPPASSASLQQELNAVRAQIADLRAAAAARSEEPTLAELIYQLEQLQAQFPRAAAEFKKIYPDGEFSIVIRITSDKNAKNPIDLMQMTGAEDNAPAMGAPAQPEPAPADK